AEGLKLAREKKFDVIISDVTMPQMDGIKMLESIKKDAPDTQIIITTGFGAVETAVYAMQKGAFNFLLKPYDLEYLLGCIRNAADITHCQHCGGQINETSQEPSHA